MWKISKCPVFLCANLLFLFSVGVMDSASLVVVKMGVQAHITVKSGVSKLTHTHTHICITCNLKFGCVSCSHISKIYQTHYEFNKTHHLSIKQNFMLKIIVFEGWVIGFIHNTIRQISSKTLWYMKEYISQKVHLFPSVFFFLEV
jgi:hypothetical protein